MSSKPETDRIEITSAGSLPEGLTQRPVDDLGRPLPAGLLPGLSPQDGPEEAERLVRRGRRPQHF